MVLSPNMIDLLHKLPVLCILIGLNIAAGMTNSMAVGKETYDKKRMLEGLTKAAIAVVSVVALGYAADIVDISNLGFTPVTMVTTGIMVYATKLAVNIVKVFGLNKHIQLPLDDSNKEVDG